MCGRFAVGGDYEPSKQLGINARDFSFQPNLDVYPGQQVTALCQLPTHIDWQTLIWGIQPTWSKRLIINARQETAAQKRTFARAFAHQRCLVPCKGWYEWRDESMPDRSRKQRYLFSSQHNGWLLMAGLWVQAPDRSGLVILTTSADSQCAEYHDRMPWLLESEQAKAWLDGEAVPRPDLDSPEQDPGGFTSPRLAIQPVANKISQQLSVQPDLFG
jgi:putative SOS response-associated peptidase YedK